MQRARPVQRHARLPIKRIDLPQIPNACLVQCAERSGKQTGGNKNQENTGDAEKPPQIDADAALVHQKTDDNGQHQTRHRTNGHARIRALLEHSNQEKHGFQTFADNGQKRHQHQRPALPAAFVQRALHRLLQAAFDGFGGFLHP